MTRRRVRRPLSLTSLIDVIFLLLLFFMLSSTFSKYGDVDMQVGRSAAGPSSEDDLMFLRLAEDSLSLNGRALALTDLADRLTDEDEPTVVVSVRPEVTAQRMTDLLVALRDAPEARVILLGDS